MDTIEFWKTLETEGEETVKRYLVEGVYNNTNKKPMVEEWLKKNEYERIIVKQKNLINLTRSAKIAAWTASIAACLSTIAAFISIFFKK